MPSDIAAQAASIAAIVVTHESAAVIERCAESLRAAAPRRGVRLVVVDNASLDASADIATRVTGPDGVVRLRENRGFAAGVNAGLERVRDADWVAVVNPDVEVPAGGLDALVDVLERDPGAGLVGPGVRILSGAPERTVGAFPTPEREWVHSWMLHAFGLPGRLVDAPGACAPVEWVSGCAWLMRAAAVRAVGPLDEDYFLYYEDIDYCHRMHDAGWRVLHAPEVVWRHGVGRGSSRTVQQPADGGRAALRYFARFHPGTPESRVRSMLVRGWRLRLAWRRLRALLGDRRSAALAERYAIAIRQVTGA